MGCKNEIPPTKQEIANPYNLGNQWVVALVTRRRPGVNGQSQCLCVQQDPCLKPAFFITLKKKRDKQPTPLQKEEGLVV